LASGNKKKTSPAVILIPVAICLAAAALGFVLINKLLVPHLGGSGDVTDSGAVKLTGEFLDASGTGEDISSVTLTTKDMGDASLTSGSSSSGYFEFASVSTNVTYTMAIEASSGKVYSADVLIYRDNEETDYANMTNGMDFAILTGDNALNVKLTVSDGGGLAATSATSSAD